MNRTPSRPTLILSDRRYNDDAIMVLAHELAHAHIADVSRRGRVRRHKTAVRDALRSAWSTAQAQCHQRYAVTAAPTADHAAILANAPRC